VKRILFVDDERQVLDGLRSMLHTQRRVWDMTFACGGELALKELATGSFDVIVSDMRMPVVDGAKLLDMVMRDHPHTIRIVLTGQTEREVSRRLVHVAHQFLAKPCSSQDLRQVIERALNLQALLEEEGLRQAVGEIDQLPSKPSTYSRLVEILAKPTSSVSDAAAVLERDVATSAKALQLVNSAFFGLPRRVTSVAEAVSYLGLELIKAVVLAAEAQGSAGAIPRYEGFSLEHLNDRAMFGGRLARSMFTDAVKMQDCVAASFLQDVGLLVLSSKMRDRFQRVLNTAREQGQGLHAAELQELGVTHAEIGAYLLGIWGLPYPVVEAVAFHHSPDGSKTETFDVVSAVHVASALAEELGPPAPPGVIGSGAVLDEEHLRRVGVLDKLPAWRALARREAQRMA
jgi:HD-like signal output (HDOD) protein/CheY-like chemotaxis protein